MTNFIIGMKTSLLLVMIIMLLSQHAFSCDKGIKVNDCTPDSEHAWNPSDAKTTKKLSRFYELNDLIEQKYVQGDFSSAKRLVNEYLELAEIYSDNWNYGNAIHDGNRIFGLISYKQGELDKAGEFLLKAGKSSGSPQLDSFGPELDLANHLLKSGKTEVVISYLRAIHEFWEMDNGVIRTWISEIESGGKPELNRFGDFRMTLAQKIVMWIALVWPIVVSIGLLLVNKKRNLSLWKFMPTAIFIGYGVMYLSSYTHNIVVENIISILPESLFIPSLYGLTAIFQFGLPLLAMYLLTKISKLAKVEHNS